MTDKKRILAKIESLLNETNYEPFTDEVFGRIQILKELKSYIDSLREEPVSDDFEKALTEMIANAQKCVIEPIVVAQQWKDYLVHLAKSEEPVKDRFAFKAIPRLLDMIEPTDKAKSYVTKLADAFDSEGYYTDAKIVRESLKIMNGKKVAMATMDEEPVSIWHDSNKEQPNYASTVAIWSPKCKNGEIISRCTEVYSDRIWAYIDDLLKM